MATGLRRKYRFRSREEAESAYIESDQQSILRYRALVAIYGEQVEWIPVPLPYKPGPYRFGLFDASSPGGLKVLIVFHPRGQSPHLVVDDAYQWASRTIEDYSRFYPTDDDGRTLHHMAYVIRQKYQDWVRQTV